MTATYQKAITLTNQISSDADDHASEAAAKLAGPVYLTGMVAAGGGDAPSPPDVAEPLAKGERADGEDAESETSEAVKVIDPTDPEPTDGTASGLSPTACGNPLNAATTAIPPGSAASDTATVALPGGMAVATVPEIQMPSFTCC
jgi:hypothetical protein